LLKGFVTAIPKITEDIINAAEASVGIIDATLKALSPWVWVEVKWDGYCRTFLVGKTGVRAEPTFRTEIKNNGNVALATWPGTITAVKESGWALGQSDFPWTCDDCKTEPVEKYRATFKADWRMSFSIGAQGGVTVFGNGGNAGANLGSDISIGSSSGEIEVFANGWSIVKDSWQTEKGPRAAFGAIQPEVAPPPQGGNPAPPKQNK
jgi:hypothetical protein